MARKYTGNSDGLAKGARPGTVRLMELCTRRWGFKNLGIFANRRMRNDQADKEPNNPKWLSVHATGRAVDMGYDAKDRAKAVQAWDWFLEHSAALGIEEIHDYAYDPDGKGKGKPWGRGYRCSRGEGKKGVKIFNDKDNAGTPGGLWLHVELSPAMADDAEKFEAAWRALPKPQ